MNKLFEDIIKAFDYCVGKDCFSCPKHEACCRLFPNNSIQEIIINLSLDCKEFNEESVNEEII